MTDNTGPKTPPPDQVELKPMPSALVESEAKRLKDPPKGEAPDSSASKMVDLSAAAEPLLAALFNLDKFDKARFKNWLNGQKPIVQQTARLKPPTRLYRLPAGQICFIYGYGRDSGNPIISVVGDPARQRLNVAPEQLTDCTDEIRTSLGG